MYLKIAVEMKLIIKFGEQIYEFVVYVPFSEEIHSEHLALWDLLGLDSGNLNGGRFINIDRKWRTCHGRLYSVYTLILHSV